MASTSHLPQLNEAARYLPHDATHLAQGFADFIAASTRLEASYSSLQLEIKQLSSELADRNAALKLSLAENQRVHQSLRQIVESMPCGVIVVDSQGGVALINSEARDMLGLPANLPFEIESVSRAAGVDLQGYMSRMPDSICEQEFCRVDASGKRWLSVRARALFQADETSNGAHGEQQTILIVRDITMHKHSEAQRERARKSIALSEVATTLAHEIRNPLTSLELFASLISAGHGDTAEWISHLHAGIRSLSATVNNVLSFHSNGFLPMTSLDLVAAVRSSAEFARPIAAEADISLTFKAAPSSVSVLANASAVQQVVLNMVCNAIRHSEGGGTVDVSVSHSHGKDAEENFAVIEFRDGGSGIDPVHLQEIFRPGFSGNGSTSGLGLAVCTQIVDQHRGRIRVTSTVGAGTTFRVEMPAL